MTYMRIQIAFGMCALFMLAPFLTTPLIAAAFLNDSEIIQIGQAPPPEPPPENTVQAPSGTDSEPSSTSGSESGAETTGGEDGAIVFSDETDGSDTTPVVTEVTVTTTSSTSDVGTDDGTDSGGASGSATGTVSTESVITTLIGNQAVVVSDGSGGGGGFFASSGGPSGIRIVANRVRESLRAQRITSLSIPNVHDVLNESARTGRRLTQNDFTLFVASAILADENIADIRWGGGTLSAEYRVLGRLLGFVPVRYTLRVSLDLSGNSAEARVRFPWYRFFLWTGTSRSSLEAALENAVGTALGDHEAEFDVATRAFTAVADVLSTRAGL